jgi:hypothetical protein
MSKKNIIDFQIEKSQTQLISPTINLTWKELKEPKKLFNKNFTPIKVLK